MRLRAVLLVLLAGAAFPLPARPVKYRQWLDSPEAVFLTAQEREQWRGVRDDAEAEAFIARFVARRGGSSFKALIEHRSGIANRFFGKGEVKGASTLRGRLVLLLGAPSRIETGEPYPRRRTPKRVIPAPQSLAGAGELGGGVLTIAPDPIASRTQVIPMVHLVALTFRVDGEDCVVVVEADDDGGKDRLVAETDRRKLDALLDRAVTSSVTKPDR